MPWPQRCIATLLLGFAAILARAESGERVALVVGNLSLAMTEKR